MIDDILKLANHIANNIANSNMSNLTVAASFYDCEITECDNDTAEVTTPAGAFPVSINAYGDWVQGWI